MGTFDTIVVGSGVAGMTTARLLAEAGLEVSTCEGYLFGGSIININELDPGLAGLPASGPELAAELAGKNLSLGIVDTQATVTGLARNADGSLGVKAGPKSLRARSVVCASGARIRQLGVPGEAELTGRGVSQCADCDGPLFKGKDVVVVGGGDSAFQEALALAPGCRSVLIVHRGSEFRAARRLVERAQANERIRILRDAEIQAIRGTRLVEGVQVRVGGSVKELKCDGVFAYVGVVPNGDYLPSDVARDERGFVLTDDEMRTTLPDVWAVGALRSGFKGTLADAVDEAARAARAVVASLASA